MNLIGRYTNGNYSVSIFEDGTKIRENELDSLDPNFPENIDLKITDFCDAGCLYCHENSTKKGLHGDLDVAFIETLKPYTELAIGGGNPLDHPSLVPFLEHLKKRNVLANLTVNQIHFEKQQPLLKYLSENKLIRGLGVSMIKSTDKFIALLPVYENIILHTINGVTSLENYKNLFDKNLKVLILGYKYLRRGADYYSESVERNKKELYDALPLMLSKFKLVSFDNLALEQLDVKRLVSEDYWNAFYMGDDCKYTMYIDLVKKEFSKSSTSHVRHPIIPAIEEMFNIAREID